MAQHATGDDDPATASETDGEATLSQEQRIEHKQKKKEEQIKRQRNAKTMGLECVYLYSVICISIW